MSIETLSEIEARVCDVTASQTGISREEISPSSRLIEDLYCDSLDQVELVMEVEQTFNVTIPEDSSDPIFKAIFTRKEFRLSDLAELVQIQQGHSSTPSRPEWTDPREQPVAGETVPFTQLGSRLDYAIDRKRLLEPIGKVGEHRLFRRRTDGMRCVEIPNAEVEIGDDSGDSMTDERPRHRVTLDSFVVDAEPVSTTAFCRFLNSIGEVDPEVMLDWFVLSGDDRRRQHVLLEWTNGVWSPIEGTQAWPMVLVSWFGANVYSLWANGRDWSRYRDESAECLLPSEAQWEYAARGERHQPYPFGDVADLSQMRFGQHARHRSYQANSMPIASVNERLGISPFGLHHMAGNVWQWCRDWYDDRFYSRSEASVRNAVNLTPSSARSERGGSWIGPAKLCRSSYRRGRVPTARGRCLGFRCVSRAAKG